MIIRVATTASQCKNIEYLNENNNLLLFTVEGWICVTKDEESLEFEVWLEKGNEVQKLL